MAANQVKSKTHPVDEVLPMNQNLMLGAQHLLVAVLGAIPVPLIIGGVAGVDTATMSFLICSTLFVAGIATILHSLGFLEFAGAKVPGVMGVSFAAVSACVTIIVSSLQTTGGYDYGFRSIAGASIVAGIFALLIGPFWKHVTKFFPLVVVGIVVTVIGISLLAVPVGWITNQAPTAKPSDVYLALFVFLTVVVLNKVLRGVAASLSVLFSLVIGTVVAYFFGMANFSSFTTAAYFGIITPFKFGLPIFELSTIIPFIVIMFLTLTEITGTLMGTHKIVGKDIDDAIIKRGTNAVGIIAILGGVFNSTICTIFAPNVGLVELSKVKSRYVTAFAGVGLIIVSLVPKLSSLITSIPLAVLGGAGFAMFGMVAASGIAILSEVSYDGNQNKLIVALSIGLAMIPTVLPHFFDNFSPMVQILFGGGITTGAITAILLNIFFNEIKLGNKK